MNNKASQFDVITAKKGMYWNDSTPLGNLVGVTVASEFMEKYNKQFSPKFAKYGIMGMQKRLKKGTSLTIVVRKATNTAKVILKEA